MTQSETGAPAGTGDLHGPQTEEFSRPMPEKVSVIFSVFNEEGSLPALFNGLRQLAGRQGGEWEFLFVDDGSNDASAALIRQFCTEATPEVTVRLIRFSRNFGHEAAMIAGIDHSACESIITSAISGKIPGPKIRKLTIKICLNI